MSTQTTVNRGQESEPAALHRLAAQAHRLGVEIVIDEDNRHWASSIARPGERYVVSLLSCSCAGFVRWGRCHHHALVLAEYFCLPPLDPEPTPDGAGEALVAPAVDVVLSIVPARSPLDQANRTACATYLDSGRDRAARWELTSALAGEDYFVASGLTDRALDAWCRTRLGLPTLELVCTSALCGGRGSFSQHPTDDVDRCAVCRGAGVTPGYSVAVAMFAAEEARHAA